MYDFQEKKIKLDLKIEKSIFLGNMNNVKGCICKTTLSKMLL